MARFYADIQGNRGEATRMGTKDSGIGGHIRGWNIGCSVRLFVNNKDEDIMIVYATSGSNGNGSNKCLGYFKVIDGKVVDITTEVLGEYRRTLGNI